MFDLSQVNPSYCSPCQFGKILRCPGHFGSCQFHLNQFGPDLFSSGLLFPSQFFQSSVTLVNGCLIRIGVLQVSLAWIGLVQISYTHVSLWISLV